MKYYTIFNTEEDVVGSHEGVNCELYYYEAFHQIHHYLNFSVTELSCRLDFAKRMGI